MDVIFSLHGLLVFQHGYVPTIWVVNPRIHKRWTDSVYDSDCVVAHRSNSFDLGNMSTQCSLRVL